MPGPNARLDSPYVLSVRPQTQSYKIVSSPRRPEVPLTGARDLILSRVLRNESGDSVEKTLTWFMRIQGAFVDICRKHRRLRRQWDHDEAYTTALQKMNEAANQMRMLALNQRYSVLASAMLPTVLAGDPVGKTVDRIGRVPVFNQRPPKPAAQRRQRHRAKSRPVRSYS
jgi:hypothetical protein